VEYILSQSKKGINDERIKKALLLAGWDEDSVSICFTEVRKLSQKNNQEKLEEKGNISKDFVKESKEESETEREEREKVTDYIFSQRKKGVKDQKIKNALLNANWDLGFISICFADVEKLIQKNKNKDLRKKEIENLYKHPQIEELQKKHFDIEKKKRSLNKRAKDENIILILVLIIIISLLLVATIVFVDFLLGL
jgi:hypothetical protein